jgi:hypothetical protein
MMCRIATRQDMQDSTKQLLHFELTESILGSCFDVMNELGSGFLESVYKNAVYTPITSFLGIWGRVKALRFERSENPTY